MSDYQYEIEHGRPWMGDWVTLEWTTNPPTQEGWYWVYDNPSITDEPVILYVYYDNGSLVIYKDDEETSPVSLFKCWLGPLPVPEPPKGSE